MPYKQKPAPKPAPVANKPETTITPSTFDLELAARVVLQRTLDLLQSKGWARGLHARDASGQPAHYTQAATLDLYGAVMLAVRRERWTAEQKDKVEAVVFRLLRASFPDALLGAGVAVYNCAATTQSEVEAVIKAAALQLGATLTERNARL